MSKQRNEMVGEKRWIFSGIPCLQQGRESNYEQTEGVFVTNSDNEVDNGGLKHFKISMDGPIFCVLVLLEKRL